MLLISNGRVLDPASGTDAPRDILLDGDRMPRSRAPARTCRRTARRFSMPQIDCRAGIHRFALPSARAGRGIFGNNRNRHAGGGARRIHSRLPMPNTRPVNDNVSVTRAILERAAAVSPVRVWPIGAASMGSKGEALSEIARDEAGGHRGGFRRRAAHRERAIVAASDGLLPRAGFAGDRSLRGQFAICRRRDARGKTVRAAGPARDACGHGIVGAWRGTCRWPN